MPIEFQCSSCNKILRAPDAAVGKRAKCKGCQNIVEVPPASTVTRTAPKAAASTPAASTPAAQPVASASPFATPPNPAFHQQPSATMPNAGQLSSNPFEAPAAPGGPPNPVTKLSAGNGKLDAVGAVSTAWKLFQENLGLLVGCIVVIIALVTAVNIAQQVIQFVAIGVSGGAGPRGLSAEQLLVVGLTTLFFFLLQLVVQAFIFSGMINLQLSVARGEKVSFGMLFSGGRWTIRAFLANLIFAIIVGLGCMALLVPGIYLAARYWSFLHFIVDKDCGALKSIKLAGEAAKGNMGQTLLFGLLSFVLSAVGAMFCGVGILATGPVVYLSATIAYLMMTGQPFRHAS